MVAVDIINVIIIIILICTLFLFVFIHCFNISRETAFRLCKGKITVFWYGWYLEQPNMYTTAKAGTKNSPDGPLRHTTSALMASESWSKRNTHTHTHQLIRLSEANQPSEEENDLSRRY